jgi:4-hydroxythreonine-4-phosphate dehydrogenase
MAKKEVVITIGDPAGCGPHITLEAIKALYKKSVDFYVVGDSAILKRLNLFKSLKNKITLVDLCVPAIKKIKPGCPSRYSGQVARAYLNAALGLMHLKKIKRLVTAPVSKEAIQISHPEFIGHTEYLANYFGRKKVEMMMVSSKCRMVVFTRHIPLRQVPSKIKKDEILYTLKTVMSVLKKKFSISKPKIALASINPHAGIDTFLEKEEKIIALAKKGIKAGIYGPFPEDTLFIPTNIKKYDCIICFYHDQAMVPFKLLSIREGVNLTLGLPIIRTSPAHGTAFDLIKTGKRPFASSMIAAIELALKLHI